MTMTNFIIFNMHHIFLLVLSAIIVYRAVLLKKQMCGDCGFQTEETIVIGIIVMAVFQILGSFATLSNYDSYALVMNEAGPLENVLVTIKDSSFTFMCWIILLFFRNKYNKKHLGTT